MIVRLGLHACACALLVNVASCTSIQVTPEETRAPQRLRVLAMHDFHGALRPVRSEQSDGRRIGGAAALKSLMDRLEKACACPTVRLDGGDQMQGTLESNLVKGASVVAALNHLGLDAAAVGNHELDWGVDTLLARQREARYGWLAANVFLAGTNERPPWAKSHVMITRGGMRIGVVGYATVDTPRTLRPAATEGYEFRAGLAGIREALDALSRERPDFVIAVAHAAGDCTANGCAGELVDLARQLPAGAVQLIVGGHDHTPGEGVVNAIPIVRAGSSARAVSVVDLYRQPDGERRFTVAREAVVTDQVGEDRAMNDLLAPYSASADAIGRRPVATLADSLNASATGDRRLGYLVADAARRAADADVAFQNPGGVRANLARGVVSYADLHRVLPFGNNLVRVTLTGRQLRELVEQAGVRYYFSNLRITHDPGAPRGSRIVALALGTRRGPVRDDATYTLAADEFLTSGGDGLTMLTTLPREVLGLTLLDATVEYLRVLPTPVSLPVERREFEVEAVAR